METHTCYLRRIVLVVLFGDTGDQKGYLGKGEAPRIHRHCTLDGSNRRTVLGAENRPQQGSVGSDNVYLFRVLPLTTIVAIRTISPPSPDENVRLCSVPRTTLETTLTLALNTEYNLNSCVSKISDKWERLCLHYNHTLPPSLVDASDSASELVDFVRACKRSRSTDVHKK